VTEQDKQAVALLRRDMPAAEVESLFDALRTKRFDQSGLCTRDLLRRCAWLPRHGIAQGVCVLATSGALTCAILPAPLRCFAARAAITRSG
jgi:hypothetical protein